jgi:hypothetical protein
LIRLGSLGHVGKGSQFGLETPSLTTTRKGYEMATREDLIVLCESAINDLEEIRAFLVNNEVEM